MINVIFEDNHLLVLNKPPLIATMGSVAGEPSLLEEAKKHLKQKYNKPGNVYLGVVSRLDAFVTGAIVFAKTSKSAARISDQFRRRVVTKKYQALVPGRVLANQGALENWIYKDDANHRMRCTQKGSHADAKLGRLTYNIVGRDPKTGWELLDIDLQTGRKHQIRVQFSNAGCPIIGDRKYDSQHSFSKGIALHCYHLAFEHPTLRTPLVFTVAPPGNWKLANYDV